MKQKQKITPITIPDRPEAILDSYKLGTVCWRRWCEAERDRIQAHGKPAVVASNSTGTRIFVGIICTPKGGRS